METIIETVQTSVNKVKKLDEKSLEISKLVGVIKNIAEQKIVEIFHLFRQFNSLIKESASIIIKESHYN